MQSRCSKLCASLHAATKFLNVSNGTHPQNSTWLLTLIKCMCTQWILGLSPPPNEPGNEAPPDEPGNEAKVRSALCRSLILPHILDVSPVASHSPPA